MAVFDTSETRPVGYQNNFGVFIPDSFSDNAFRGVYDGNNNLIYKAVARPGTATTEQGWQLAKLSYDGNNNLISITWPVNAKGNPSNDYEFIQADYLSYTYM